MILSRNTLIPLVVAALLTFLSSHAQNFDCADQKQALGFCSLVNATGSSLTECLSCVYPEFPTDPTFDCPAYSDEVCGLVQANCSDACPLTCVNEFNAWVSCAADHPRRCNVTCDFTSEDGTPESGVSAPFRPISLMVAGIISVVTGAVSVWM